MTDAPNPSPPPRPRFVRPDGGRSAVRILGRPRSGFQDAYHGLLTMAWWRFGALAATSYLALNLLFGCLYWLDGGGLAGARPGSFADAFNFSVETLGTIGYGAISPRDGYANALVAVEAFLSIAVTALATGLIFARVSRPTARVIFAKTALITTFDGQRVFMFRAANQRDNQVLEADVMVSLAQNLRTAEGLSIRRLYDLPLQRQRSPLFSLTWTVIHTIDAASPLYGKTIEDLAREQAELVIVLAGTDSVFASRIHARHSYTPDEIGWDLYYDDVIYPGDEGGWVADYRRFHNTHARDGAPAVDSSAPLVR